MSKFVLDGWEPASNQEIIGTYASRMHDNGAMHIACESESDTISWSNNEINNDFRPRFLRTTVATITELAVYSLLISYQSGMPKCENYCCIYHYSFSNVQQSYKHMMLISVQSVPVWLLEA